MNKVLKYITK